MQRDRPLAGGRRTGVDGQKRTATSGSSRRSQLRHLAHSASASRIDPLPIRSFSQLFPQSSATDAQEIRARHDAPAGTLQCSADVPSLGVFDRRVQGNELANGSCRGVRGGRRLPRVQDARFAQYHGLFQEPISVRILFPARCVGAHRAGRPPPGTGWSAPSPSSPPSDSNTTAP